MGKSRREKKKSERRSKFRRTGEPSIPDFTDINSDEAQRFFATIARESPRGLVLVTAALLDDAVELLLRRTIFPLLETDTARKDSVEWLLGTDPRSAEGPLKSAGVRTRLAYAVGVIGPNAFQVLKAITFVRNIFAHQTAFTFDDPDLSKELFDEFLPPLLANEKMNMVLFLRRKRMKATGVTEEDAARSTLLHLIEGRDLDVIAFRAVNAAEEKEIADRLLAFELHFQSFDPRNQYLQAFMAIYAAIWRGIRAAEADTAKKAEASQGGTLSHLRFGYMPAEIGLS